MDYIIGVLLFVNNAQCCNTCNGLNVHNSYGGKCFVFVGITQKQYFAAIRGETDITFVCKPCSTSAQNGTQVESEEVAALGNATDVMEAEDKPVNEQVLYNFP